MLAACSTGRVQSRRELRSSALLLLKEVAIKKSSQSGNPQRTVQEETEYVPGDQYTDPPVTSRCNACRVSMARMPDERVCRAHMLQGPGTTQRGVVSHERVSAPSSLNPVENKGEDAPWLLADSF